MRPFAFVDDQIERHAPARAHEHGRHFGWQPRPVGGDEHVGGQFLAVLGKELGQARAAGGRCTIFSSYKDLMQLVGDGVEMLDAMKNKTIDRDGVFEKFGVYPERVVDVQALAGDSVDNVPGAPGIGIKTAALLINEYGDLDALLERAGEIKQPKRRQTLIDHAEQIRLSRNLVLLDENTPLDFTIDDLEAVSYTHLTLPTKA